MLMDEVCETLECVWLVTVNEKHGWDEAHVPKVFNVRFQNAKCKENVFERARRQSFVLDI